MMSDQDVDPFAELETIAEVVGFTFKRFGSEAAREALEAAVDADLSGEALEEAADQLARLGMAKAAALCLEMAKDAILEVELDPYVPGSVNSKAWQAMMERSAIGSDLFPSFR